MNVNRSMCCYCGGCIGICPVDAMTLSETMLTIDDKKCTDCGLCAKFCPVGAIKNERG